MPDQKAQRRLDALDGTVEALHKTIRDLEEKVIALERRLDEVAWSHLVPCKACGTPIDIFANHYSIGLFDNLVYVKCPQCQKSMPVDSRKGVQRG